MMLVAFAAASITALALWPLARAWPRTRVHVTAGLIVLLTGIAAWDDGWRPAPPPDRPIVISDPTDEYATSAACRACHPGEHASWQASFHRRMTQIAGPDTVIPDIDREDFDYLGEQYAIETRGQQTFVTVGGRTRRVVQTTGSHHAQVYWYPTGRGRELAMFPFCYKIAERSWMPIDAAFIVPPGTRQATGHGRWNTNCNMCHATGSQPRLDQFDTRVAEFAIACEACHGPGQRHVDANANPLRRLALSSPDAHDDTIENPARLDPQRSAEACGQCHSISIVRSEQAEAWRTTGLTFRPGDALDATRVIVTPDSREPEVVRLIQRQPGFLASKFWPDGVVRIAGRELNGLRESPCFTHGDAERTMTCTSCHLMHPSRERDLETWRDDQLREQGRSNQACTQCHDEYRDPATLTAHTHHAANSSGSNCYNCHMSHTTYGLLKAVRSHTITSPDVQTSLATGRPNACNQCHLDRSLGWTAEHLAERYGTPRPELDEDERRIAASVLWALRGDAAQRAFMAWSFGWAPARAASGSDWMLPYLAQLMQDPYDAVRHIAAGSLRADPEFADLRYDFFADQSTRAATIDRVRQAWRTRTVAARESLLIDQTGRLVHSVFDRLLATRDRRPVFLTE